MAKFKAPDLEALQNEDGEISEEALDELIEKDKNYKANNDGTHLNNIHIMRIVKFVDRELGRFCAYARRIRTRTGVLRA